MSELSWLLDLLFKHPLDEKLKKHVVKRIGIVEKQMNQGSKAFVHTTGYMHVPQPINQTKIVNGAPQSASFIAAMEKHEAPQIPGIAAATQATAQAMASREAAIRMAETGKPMPGQTSPRKF